METLEKIIGKEKITNKELINGDTLIGTIRSDGEELKGKTYYFTKEGDIYYFNKENELHQPVYNHKRKQFIENKKTRVENLNKEETKYATKEEEEMSKLINKLKKIRNKKTIDENYWFKEQLKNEKNIQIIKEKKLIEILKEYKARNTTIKPFGKETKEEEIIMEENRKPTKEDKKTIQGIINYLESNETKEREKITTYADKILEGIIINKKIYIEKNKGLGRFFHEHGLNNRGEKHEGIFNYNRKEQTFWIYGNEDKIRIKYERIEKKPEYKRKEIPLQEIIEKEGIITKIKEKYKEKIKKRINKKQKHTGTNKIRQTWKEKKEEQQKRITEIKEKIKKRINTYTLGIGLAMGTIGFIGGIQYQKQKQETTNKTIKQTEMNNTKKEKENYEKNTEKTKKEKIYIIEKGDCIWNIVKKNNPEFNNKEIIEQTNKITKRNNKISIKEYEQRKKEGKEITKKINPNIIYPGDTLYIPTTQKTNIEKLLKEKTIKENKKRNKTIEQIIQETTKKETYNKKEYNKNNNKENKEMEQQKIMIPTTQKNIWKKEEKENNQEKYTTNKKLMTPITRYTLENKKRILNKINLTTPTQQREYNKKEKKAITTNEENKTTNYLEITKRLAELKNKGKNLQEIIKIYDGFTEKNIKQAYQDYQGYVQAGMIKNPTKIKRYDHRIASEDLKNKIIHEYKNNKNNLRTISEELTKEYGMNISTSTISKYARNKLEVKNRKEAKEI